MKKTLSIVAIVVTVLSNAIPVTRPTSNFCPWCCFEFGDCAVPPPTVPNEPV